MPNPNHPVKNSQIKVDPIKNLKDIKSIKKLLKNNLRDYALFIIGVNTNLRASDLVKGWCRQINLTGNYGSHSLRKTWGYHQRVTFNSDLPTLMTCFNHSTQRQTLKYLCVQPGEVKAIYQNEI